MGTVTKPLRAKHDARLRPGDAIEITIGDDGRPLCDPFYAHIDPDDTKKMTLRWNYKGGSWTIRFLDGRTPLEDGGMQVTGSEGEAHSPSQISASATGHYRYAVAAARFDREKNAVVVALDATCPEVVIGV